MSSIWGARFDTDTVNDVVADVVPSDTKTINSWDPMSSASVLQVMRHVLLMLASVGFVGREQVRVSPSASVADTRWMNVSPAVSEILDMAVIVGARFDTDTINDVVADVVPSDTKTVNSWGPLSSASVFQVIWPVVLSILEPAGLSVRE